jgi:hypothetical protein
MRKRFEARPVAVMAGRQEDGLISLLIGDEEHTMPEPVFLALFVPSERDYGGTVPWDCGCGSIGIQQIPKSVIFDALDQPWSTNLLTDAERKATAMGVRGKVAEGIYVVADRMTKSGEIFHNPFARRR